MEENQVVSEEVQSKKLKFTTYKTKAALVLDTWLSKGKILLKIAPAIEGKLKGQPEKGSSQYQWEDKAISIGFSYQDLLRASYKLNLLSYGDKDAKYEKYADLSKVQEKDLKGNKKLSIYASSYESKGNTVNIISVNLSLDDQKLSIALDLDEAYALAKHFEYVYQFCLNKTLAGELNGDK